MSKSKVLRLRDAEALSRFASEEFVRCAKAAIRERGCFKVVLSGGSTPRQMLERLAAPPLREEVDWRAVDFFWGDERAVSPDHPDSNYRMAAQALLDSLELAPTQIHRMQGEREDLDEAARDYQVEIAHVCGADPDSEPPALDLVFLGMGGDGHTASLFPHTVALESSRRWVVSNFVPKFSAARLTMTPTLLNAASRLVFLISGEEKAEALAAVLEGPHAPEEYPSQLIAPDPGELLWAVDRAASAELVVSEDEEGHPSAAVRGTAKNSSKTILAGDVGGTKTMVALYSAAEGRLELRREAVFPSSSHASLEEVLNEFRAVEPAVGIDAACFGVAGAVVDGHTTLTNLDWTIDEGALAHSQNIPHVSLLNDLEAMAYGMLDLGDDEREVLNPPRDPERRGNIAVIAAGTGLGQAMLIWDGERHLAVATEGGHGNFGPRDEEEIELLRFLQRSSGSHVSYEQVVSGPGLLNIYHFLRSRCDDPEPSWLAEAMRAEDPSAAVGSAGVEGSDPLCVRAVEMFASIYGAEAGNLALRCVAIGGVMIGGGIAPKLLPVLRRGTFLESLFDKGHYAELLRGIEVSVALDPRTALRGSAAYAARTS